LQYFFTFLKTLKGAYFVCNDHSLNLIKSSCVVLSFGVNTNDAFDEDVNLKLDCHVHSFDPYVQPPRVDLIKKINADLVNKVTIKIKHNWFFHSIGITNGERVRKKNEIGWLDTYENILKYIGLEDKIIDVFKLDIEGAEW
jgi:hypothetical protein